MEASKMRWYNGVLLTFALALAAWAGGQAPDFKNIGRTPTPEEIKAWDIAVGPAGKELPPGSGTAKEGEAIYARKCAACHGANLQGNRALGAPALKGGEGTLASLHIKRTIGSYWPYATTVWDYIDRAMPMGQGGSLKPDAVYSLTAFLLYQNHLIKETDVIDAKTLPKIKMPNRPNFIPLNPVYNPQAVRPYGAY